LPCGRTSLVPQGQRRSAHQRQSGRS
jgi:hypothetical protein